MGFDTPLLVVNLKTYEEGSGDDALAIALQCEKVALMEDVNVAVAVQNADIHRITEHVDIPVIAQHLDPHPYGPHTGKDISETLAFNGAGGVLINHSEDQLPLDDIADAVARARKNGLGTIVAVDVPEMVEHVNPFNPDLIAYEPADLIGGGTSVTSASPELVAEAAETADAPLLCGAGVRTGDDVRAAREQGAVGVLVASGVVKASEPADALRELVEGLQ